ncbi:ZN395 protein, partial [Amia calva]|nr:ZN395 protein [Amia calva]
MHHFKLYPGQKVFVSCCGQECAGVVEQHNHVDNEVSVFLPALAQHTLRKIEDVWLMSSSPEPSQPRRVSSSIAVPKSYKSPEAVDMDEIMAAMVLTSLSCSPVVQSTSQKDTPNRGGAVPAAAGAMECGELSDSGSSGYWSWDRGNGSPAPSPPIAEDGQQATPTDEGLDMELEHVLFDDPTPRKRKNSMKVVYKCLWPNCGKILTSVVGIKRHIRTLHLRHSTDLERSRREEDFYYTEVSREAETASTGPGTRLAELPASEAQQPSPLSQSAPSSFWQVRSEHSYQPSRPGGPQPSLPHLVLLDACSCHHPEHTVSQCPPCPPQVAPFRSRSVSVGEQWLQQHSAPCRKARGEAKKCRKVYGIEHRDQWCTACRWKKACQRFLD